MLKKKLPLIFILFLGSLVLITYTIQNNLINLSNSEKLINSHSNSNDIKELDLLPIELDSESKEVLTSDIAAENVEPEVTNNEISSEEVEVPQNQEVTTPLIDNSKEEPKDPPKEIEYENWQNWRPGISILPMFLPSVNSEPRVKTTTHVVMHFASNAGNNQTNPYNISDTYSIFKEYEVSSHYVIDRSGQVYLFVPETRVAYHAGRGNLSNFPTYGSNLNHYSIGIELLAIGTKSEMTPIITGTKFDLIPQDLIGYTESQYNALNILLDDIL